MTICHGEWQPTMNVSSARLCGSIRHFDGKARLPSRWQRDKTAGKNAGMCYGVQVEAVLAEASGINTELLARRELR
jgi:hypothetical protein